MSEIIIVGGGVAGLSAGIFACLRGHQVVILEQNAHPGGNLTGWKRKDCILDNCIHWLTGTNPASKTFSLWHTLGALNDTTELIRKPSLFTVENGEQSVTLWRDLERLSYELRENFPDDRKQVERFLSAVTAMEHLGRVGGKENQSRSWAQVLHRMPDLVYFYRRSAGQVAQDAASAALKSFFTALTGADFSSLGLISAASAFCSGNGDIPKGGSFAMAVRMAKRFSSLGGVLQTNTRVLSVIGGNRPLVKLENGDRRSADYVILATEPGNKFGIPAPKGLSKQSADTGYHSFSALQAAYLCRTETLPFSGILLLPTDNAGTGYLALREFSHEPDFAPPGHSLLQAMLLCDEQTSLRWIALREHREDYLSEKAALAVCIANTVQKRFPELCGKLQCVDVWTPATYRKWTGAELGGFMANTLPPDRLPRQLSPKAPGQDHILWATQWLQAPGGLPYAALAGRKAASMIPDR